MRLCLEKVQPFLLSPGMKKEGVPGAGEPFLLPFIMCERVPARATYIRTLRWSLRMKASLFAVVLLAAGCACTQFADVRVLSFFNTATRGARASDNVGLVVRQLLPGYAHLCKDVGDCVGALDKVLDRYNGRSDLKEKLKLIFKHLEVKVHAKRNASHI
jgi:hypothetical protein